MPGKLRKFAKGFFIITNILVAIIYLLACLAPYLNPANWWLMGFLAIGFPILLAILLIYLVFWLFINRRRALFCFIVLLAGCKNISNVFAFHLTTGTRSLQPKNETALRVMTWNVRRFVPLGKEVLEHVKNIDNHLEVIRRADPDVLCLQEYCTSKLKKYVDADTILKTQLGFKYSYFSRDYTWWVDNGLIFCGTMIFSKYPLHDPGVLRFVTSGRTSESLTYADVIKNNDTIRILNTHLQSYTFNAKDYRNFEKIKNQEDSAFDASVGIIRKMKRAFMLRSEQADDIKKFADSSPYPEIICGDFNDVPNSYAYHDLLGNRNDAFLEKGFGFGRTYTGFFPTLRIDFFLTDPKIELLQFKKMERKLSDHYPLVVDVRVKR